MRVHLEANRYKNVIRSVDAAVSDNPSRDNDAALQPHLVESSTSLHGTSMAATRGLFAVALVSGTRPRLVCLPHPQKWSPDFRLMATQKCHVVACRVLAVSAIALYYSNGITGNT